MGWRIIYACAGQGIEAARVRRVRGLYSIGYITGRMDVEGAGGETDAATCGSRLGGSHLIFDLTLLHHFFIHFPFYLCASRNQQVREQDQDQSSALTDAPAFAAPPPCPPQAWSSDGLPRMLSSTSAFSPPSIDYRICAPALAQP